MEDSMTDIQQAVSEVLVQYNQALNASRTDAVMSLYTQDGVFMPPFSSSAVGAKAVRKAYDNVFKAIRLTVKFDVEEVIEMSPEWALARTNSTGTTLNHATGQTSVEGNQELFVLRKEGDSTWKIARYCFATTNPPPSA
jgi:uncharacterized protein (TIGR02246 family)